ncbi:MAG: FKBP-type peptidyl-prolyl cis-trans isomerase [Gammaproteobacteria bacterium]|nr:FKBP-type peptidyl-prolyl cis-trans isomerase [Gammaproteobacteria bacterium]
MTETIKRDKFVSLTYSITDKNNEILERIDMPVNYVHGRDSQVIDKIETALEGHQEGDEISVELSPEEGFGEHQSELTFTDDIDNVPPEFRHVGAEVEFQNDKGESRMFRVSKIKDGKLTVDGNHPFAGKAITYNIRVNTVRDATPDEITNGAIQAPSLH